MIPIMLNFQGVLKRCEWSWMLKLKDFSLPQTVCIVIYILNKCLGDESTTLNRDVFIYSYSKPDNYITLSNNQIHVFPEKILIKDLIESSIHPYLQSAQNKKIKIFFVVKALILLKGIFETKDSEI